MKDKHVSYAAVPLPVVEVPEACPLLPREVFARRRERACAGMRAGGLDFLLVYADREHCANFEWLAGFDPRFEEAVLLLQSNGAAAAVLGNENRGMPEYAGFEGRTVHFPTFSLLNQPRRGSRPFRDILAESGVGQRSSVGVCGWKHYIPEDGCLPGSFETPHWIVEAVKESVGPGGTVVNAASLLMSPSDGLRTVIEVEQAALYEYACCLVSRAYQRLLAALAPGTSERELAAALTGGGFPRSVHPMISTGEKARWGLSSPSDRRITRGDFLTSGYGLKGALMARAAFVASSPRELPAVCQGWLEEVAMPYFRTAAAWYQSVRTGEKGGRIYSLVESGFPQERFGWTLNPGHYIGDDEWISSPFFPGSEAVLRSGSYLQFDLIPDPPAPLFGANMEDGFLLADRGMRAELELRYPQASRRIQRRRAYLAGVLGMQVSEDLLPLSDLAGFYTPFLLEKNKALVMS